MQRPRAVLVLIMIISLGVKSVTVPIWHDIDIRQGYQVKYIQTSKELVSDTPPKIP